MKKYFLALALVCPALAFTSCDLDTSVTKTFHSTASLDGTVNSSGVFNALQDLINAGDALDNSTSRGFFSFDISSIAPSAGETLTIHSAMLRIYMWGVDGNPYDLGPTLCFLVDYGDSLEETDYDTPNIYSCGIISSTAGIMEERSIDITGQIRGYIESGVADRFRPQFRLGQATATDNDNMGDQTRWCAGEHATVAYRPSLIITYSK